MRKVFCLFIFLISAQVLGTDPRTALDLVHKKQAFIVDVREINEIQDGMIEHALWYPKSELLKDKYLMESFVKMTAGKKVFLYCERGGRSGVCTEFLKSKGVDAENLGGFQKLKAILPTKSLMERLNHRQQCSL